MSQSYTFFIILHFKMDSKCIEEQGLERWLRGLKHLLLFLGDPQHSVTPTPANPMSSFGLGGHWAHMWYAYIQAGKTFLHMKWINLKYVEKSCLIAGETAERKLSTDTLRVATVSPSFTSGSVGQLCFCCQALSYVLGEVLAAFRPLYHHIRSGCPFSQANFGNQIC